VQNLFMIHLHSFLRYAVLVAALYTLYKIWTAWRANAAFEKSTQKANLLFMILCDIQLLIGLYLYFVGPWGIKNIQNMGMANVMHDKVARFFAVEHFAGMLVALVLVHLAYATANKNSSDLAKHKKMFWFNFIALLVMLASIPWPFRAAIGRAWFPGM
jgi:heme A synthase